MTRKSLTRHYSESIAERNKRLDKIREKALARAEKKADAPSLLDEALSIARQEHKEAAYLTPEELYSIQGELDKQLTARPVEQVAVSLPESQFRDDVVQIAQGSPEQRRSALKASLVGGLAGGAAGAGIMAPFRGVHGALIGGLTGAVPGAMGGYYVGKRKQRRAELGEALDRALQEYTEY